MGALCFLPAEGCNFGIERSGQLAQQNHQGQGVTLPTLLMAPDPRAPREEWTRLKEGKGREKKSQETGSPSREDQQSNRERKTTNKGHPRILKGRSRTSLQRRITRASDQRFGNTQDVGEKHKN